MAKRVTLAELKKMISKLNTLKLGKENMLESLGIEKVKMKGKFADLADDFMDAIEAIAEDDAASKKCPKIYETFFNRLVEQVEEDEPEEDSGDEEDVDDEDTEEDEEDEPEEKPTRRRSRKKKPTTKTQKKAVTKTKKKGPSNKFIIWEKWNSRKKKPTVEELLELVDNAVKESTVKKWVARWKKGVGLPAGAE